MDKSKSDMYAKTATLMLIKTIVVAFYVSELFFVGIIQ
jgi:hypothetical protein